MVRRRDGSPKIRHRMTGTAVYSSWKHMLRRVGYYGDPDPGYETVDVEPRWYDFTKFLEDMGDPPPGFTLDRIDTTRGYSKENCRWASARTQVLNRKPYGVSRFRGVSLSHGRWRAKIVWDGTEVYLGMYDTEIEAAHAFDQFIFNADAENTPNFKHNSRM